MPPPLVSILKKVTNSYSAWLVITGCTVHRLNILNIISFCILTSNKTPEYFWLPEVSRMKYCCLGVFRKEYFRHVTKECKNTKILI